MHNVHHFHMLGLTDYNKIIYVDVDDSFNAIIYNYQGQVVKNVNADNGQIDISDLTSGMYFLEIRTGNNVTVNKVLVR